MDLQDDFAMLWKVCNGLEHPVGVKQGQQVLEALLLPQ